MKEAIAANTSCYVLHPEHGDTIIAEGRIGGSWKSPSGRYGSLCAEGEHMVQLHRIVVSNLPLLFVKQRQPFTLMGHALVKPKGSNVYVRWLSKLLWQKNLKLPHAKTPRISQS
ncbi:hypothetical protein KC19_VG316500 [Ceratodon purpureus]|uniref:Uncharacterized protein n=1 Tax=Ceratodon purpureus TaxID=3225 RepID=A0A8T0HWK9_CERPU|nr:hypothetical protein KC19_VG316500 [Ceratodon purpureus]